MNTGRRDRFLWGILMGIGVLIIVALILYFSRSQNPPYRNDSSPEGVTYNYFLAIRKQEYEKAYRYLLPAPGGPDLDSFAGVFSTMRDDTILRYSVEVGSGIINEEAGTASVPVYLIHTQGDPFDSEDRISAEVELVRQADGWKIRRSPYPFWHYQWESR